MSITREQILEWTHPRATELREVEFKLEPPPSDDKIKKIVKTVAGIANQGGGCIIFGVGDEKDETGRRERKSITLAAEQTSRWFERVVGTVRTTIQPFTDTNHYDVQVEKDWTVVVLEIPPPRDPYLRLYQWRPYTRTGKPETVRMEPGQVWLFHKENLESEIVNNFLLLLWQDVHPCLADIAFRMYERGDRAISEDEAKLISNKHATKDSATLWETVISHDVIQYDQKRRELGFISRTARDLYVSYYLNRLSDEELLDYIRDDKWHRQLVMLAGVLGTYRLRLLVTGLFEKGEPLLAVQCLLARERGEIDADLRSYVLNFVRAVLQQPHSDTMLRGMVLDAVRKTILRDPDQYLRVQMLNQLEEVSLPLSFLVSLLRLLDPGTEPDENLRHSAAWILAQAQLSYVDRTVLEQLIEDLINLLEYNYEDARTFEVMLSAVDHLARQDTIGLSEHSAGTLSGALERYHHEIIVDQEEDDTVLADQEEDTDLDELSQPIEEMLANLQRLVTEAR